MASDGAAPGIAEEIPEVSELSAGKVLFFFVDHVLVHWEIKPSANG
jgi:hypothetical protein